MTPLGRNLLAVSAALLLSACGLFGDDDEELEPAELIEFETKVPVKRLWSEKIGADAEFLRVALRPTGDGNRIYAASVNGNVVALDPESGKQIWRNKLGIEFVVRTGRRGRPGRRGRCRWLRHRVGRRGRLRALARLYCR